MTLVATAAISGLSGTTNAQAAVTAAPIGSTLSSAYASRILVLVNVQRARYGLRPVYASPCATRIAAPWTTYMARTNTLKHQSLTPILNCPARYAGENIAYGNVTADQMMTMWMNSAGHRANILNPRFNRLGIGAVRTTTGRWWATQDFAQAV